MEGSSSVVWIVKAALGLIGGASIIASTVYATDLLGTRQEPVSVFPWLPLVSEISSDYNGKLGESYKYYLYAVYGKSTKNINKPWWKASYDRYLKDKENKVTFSTHFANVTIPYSSAIPTEAETTKTNNPQALNIVCKNAYLKGTGDVVKTPNGKADDDKVRLWRDIWTYCSELGHPPKFISEMEGEAESYIAEGALGKTKKDELLSVIDSTNDILWKWKAKSFMSTSSETFKNILYFKPLRSKKSTEPLVLKEKCKSAYAKKASTDTNGTIDAPTEEHAKKYCSLDG